MTGRIARREPRNEPEVYRPLTLEFDRAAAQAHRAGVVARIEAQVLGEVAGAIMEEVALLNVRRKALSDGDPVLGMALSDIFAQTIIQAQTVQMSLFRGR